MKTFKILVGLFLVVGLVSCSNNDEADTQQKNLRINAKSTFSGLSGKSANQSFATGVLLESFKINIKEIEFETSEDIYGDDEEFELKGPFELNLLNTQQTVVEVNVPNGVYEEVKFKMDKNKKSTSSMFNKSIEIKGTINGVPFIFWHNAEQEFEIDYEDIGQSLVINNNSAVISFDFDLNSVIASVNLTNATDNNNDGLIEISPMDTDGNNALANLIILKIEQYTDLLDD
ncbi:MAG: DUF4382 domain-containing protein [Flavobacteriales bacterium]|nr:DUF4382 domain-containing protein [Flavobacteriales bacterium]